MKKIYCGLFVLFLIVIFNNPLNAQISNYAFSQQTGQAYTEISGGTALYPGSEEDDSAYPFIPIGFTFQYNGSDYTTFEASTNGYISFVSTGESTFWGNNPLEYFTRGKIIAVFACDLWKKATSELMYKTEGIAPNRVFTIQYKNFQVLRVPEISSNLNFQIKLYENSNQIKYCYNSMTVQAGYDFSPQIGISGTSNADFICRTTSNNWTATTNSTVAANCTFNSSSYPPAGLVYTYATTPSLTTQAVSNIGANTATGNGTITSLGRTNPTQYGVVWSTSTNPTVGLSTKTTQGAIAATGAFTSNITGLMANTLYYVRAYATNDAGTGYGPEVSFTTLNFPLTITAPTLTSKVYDGTTDAGSVTTLGTVSGKISGDDVTVNIATSVFDNKNAGTGKTVTVTYSLSGADMAKYSAPGTSTVASGEITAKPITVTANTGQTKVYGVADPSFTYAVSPALIVSDNFTGLLSRASGENVGTTYAINLGTLSAGTNYNITFVSKDFNISRLDISGTFTTNNKTYDTNNAASITGRSLVGVLTADLAYVSLTGGTAVFSDALVGPGKVVTSSGMSLIGTAATNYNLTGVAATTANISRLDISGTFTAGNKTYSGNNSASITGRSLVGVLAADLANVSLTGGIATFSDALVGAGKVITQTGMSLSGTAATNYNLTGVATATANISKLDISGTFAAVSKTYDGNNTASITGRSLVGVLTADIANVSLTGGTATFSDALVGTGKVVTSSGMSLSGTAAINYNLTGVATIIANITRMNIGGSFTAGNKSYDGNNTTIITGRSLAGVLTADIANVSLTGGTATFSNALVGTGKVVTSSGMSLSGTAATNYNLTGVATTTANISMLNISGIFTAGNKIYDGNNAASITGRSLAGVLTADLANVSLTGGTATFSDALAGTGKVVISSGMSLSGTASSNYNLIGVATSTANISALNISGIFTAGNKTYDGNNAASITGRSLVGALTADLANVSLIGETATFSDALVGTGKIVTSAGMSLSGTAAINYHLVSVATTTANISKAMLTVTTDAGQTKEYGDVDPVFTYSVSPAILNGENFTGALSREIGENVSSYVIGLGTLTNPNYDITFVSSNFSIIVKQITVTANTGQTKVFGTADPVFAYSVSPASIGSDHFTGTLSRATGENVGSYAIGLGTLNAGTNYTIRFLNNDFTINAKPITVTANPGQTKIYGTIDPVIAYTFTPALIGGDAFTGALTRAMGENAGNHTIEIGSLSVGTNYSLNLANQVFNISRLDISGIFSVSNKTYDGNNRAIITSRSPVGMLTADIANISLTGGTATFSDDLVGIGKVVTSSGIGLSGTAAANYNLTGIATTTANITKLDISGKFTASNKTYDGNNTATITSRSLDGVLTTDRANVNLTGGTATFSDAIVGAGKVATSSGMGLTGTAAANYNLTGIVLTSADIIMLDISGTFTASNKTYDGNNTASITGHSLVGVLTADLANVNLTGGTATFNDALVGTGKVVASSGMVLSGIAATNYHLKEVATTTADISKAMLTITTDEGQTKVYGATDPVFTYVTEPTLLGEDNFTGALSRTPGETAGSYAINIGTISAGTNYTITFVSNDFRITAKPITVTADAGKTKIYGDVDPLFTYSVSEALANGNGISGSLSRTGGENVGFYSINIGTLSAGGNYEINFESKDFNIIPKALSIGNPVLTASKTYNGLLLANVSAGTLTGVIPGDGGNVSISAVGNYTNKNIGSDKTITVVYALTGSASGNYTKPTDYTVSNGVIVAKPLTIGNPTITTNKMYDGSTTAVVESVGTLSGIEAVDAGTVSVTAAANYNDAKVGVSKTITVVYAIDGIGAGNYLAPASFLINTAKISDKLVLNTLQSPTAGCEGSSMELSYSVISGTPVQYQVIFGAAALSAGFQNINYTDLTSLGNNGIVSIAVPSGIPYGTYQASLQVRNELGLVSDLYTFQFVVNVSSDFIIDKFDDVVLFDNNTNSFSNYQWYKNGKAIDGANRQFYNDPAGLVGAYSLKLKTVSGKDLQTCSKVLNIPKVKKVSVSVYPNPMRANQESTVKITGMSDEELQGAVMSVYNIQGIRVYSTKKVEQLNSLILQNLDGSYVGHIITAKGNDYVYRILLVK